MVRNNPVETITREEFDAKIAALHEYLGSKWLSQSEEHPVRRLWNRTDSLATLELLNLSHSISVMMEVDAAWTLRQLKKVRLPDRNQQQGAIFELIALSGLVAAGHTVRPASESQAGYDGTVTPADGGIPIRVSVKHYGRSAHELAFRAHCSALESDLRKILKKADALHLSVISTEHCDPSDWKPLRQLFQGSTLKERMSAATGAASQPQPLKAGKWLVFAARLPEKKGDNFSKNHASYTLAVLMPQHHNEAANLIAKLEEAQTNLFRHVPDDDYASAIMVHLAPGVPTLLYQKWVDTYFFSPDARRIVDAVCFFQPAPARRLSTSKAPLTIYSVMIRANRKSRIGNRGLMGVYFAGTVVREPVPTVITDEHGKSMFEVSGYCYQTGHHYVISPDLADWHVGSPSTGVHVHQVDERHVVTANLSPDGQLLIL